MTNPAGCIREYLLDHERQTLTWMLDVEKNGLSSKVSVLESTHFHRSEHLVWILARLCRLSNQ
jgi:hypothetical protein